MSCKFELWQGGMKVAAVDCPEYHTGLREISHYAMMYEQDGPIELRENSKNTGFRWKRAADHPKPAADGEKGS